MAHLATNSDFYLQRARSAQQSKMPGPQLPGLMKLQREDAVQAINRGIT